MPIVGNSKTFVLTNLTSEYPHDLICCNDGMDREFITSSLRLQGTSFEIIDEARATELLQDGQTLGFNCFLATGDPAKDAAAKRKATALYLGLSLELGVIRFSEPTPLLVSMPASKAAS